MNLRADHRAIAVAALLFALPLGAVLAAPGAAGVDVRCTGKSCPIKPHAVAVGANETHTDTPTLP